ncbi:MAG: hypothetical protein COU85_02325 [Candidatus Portnoybacteria bacterium CG10_big_fil_rev_8_21_14_0_10_44_7]|uniref:Small ribosomal subunit protein bS6 n=1 Tax=Candidatus Portnoybacteria bacterium CG10_big_fil_rev_8_21_14_0_10_44_7 TaxID=1974816 RepID=A0A2M8KIF0_9BACT|nr:MAG: hypothetical protein COU85_02325 [Candidatus Portnoybacteria bacterium CG10_big_fil_rev_8_21_14_0_10_44_7]
MYELTLLASPEISEDDLQKLTAAVKSFLLKHQAELKNEKLGRKQKLAYPIAKKEFGSLLSFDFQAENPEVLPELVREIKAQKQILRFLLITKPNKIKSSVPLPRPKPPVLEIKKKKSAAPPPTPEEKAKQLQEIDKKLDEILKD